MIRLDTIHQIELRKRSSRTSCEEQSIPGRVLGARPCIVIRGTDRPPGFFTKQKMLLLMEFFRKGRMRILQQGLEPRQVLK